MSFVDLLFLENRENVAQIFEYIFSRSERFQFKSLLHGEGPWNNIFSDGVRSRIQIILGVMKKRLQIRHRNIEFLEDNFQSFPGRNGLKLTGPWLPCYCSGAARGGRQPDTVLAPSRHHHQGCDGYCREEG